MAEDESPGTPLGRLKAIADFAIAAGLCTGTEGAPPESFVLDRFSELVLENERFTRDQAERIDRARRYMNRIIELEAERDNLKTIAYQRWEIANARISQLEAERDQFAEQAALRDNRDRDMQEIMRINNELLVERDALKEERDTWKEEHGKLLDDTAEFISDSAIRLKTIEECAAVAESMTGRVRSPITKEVAGAIRALANTR